MAVAAVNDPPVFTRSETLRFANGVAYVDQITASDPDAGDIVKFRLAGAGADNVYFDLTEAGVLSFLVAPDTENPIDSNLDNEYEIAVEAYDDGLLSVEQNITIIEEAACAFFVVGAAVICL